jgi:hypothetical protein
VALRALIVNGIPGIPGAITWVENANESKWIDDCVSSPRVNCGHVLILTRDDHGRTICRRRCRRQRARYLLRVRKHIEVRARQRALTVTPRCSHAGIVNVVRDALERFSRPIYMIVGGLHLGAPELLDRIPPTVEFLSKTLRPAPTYVLPMHCSGFQTKIALEKAFGDGCLPACSGMVCDIASDTSIDDERLAISWR